MAEGRWQILDPGVFWAENEGVFEPLVFSNRPLIAGR